MELLELAPLLDVDDAWWVLVPVLVAAQASGVESESHTGFEY